MQQPVGNYTGPAYKHERTPFAVNSSQFQLALQQNMQNYPSNSTSQHQSHSNLAQQSAYGSSILTSQ